MADLATRAYNHSFHIDPIIRSLMDTDFYKFLMGQLIFRHHQDVDVTFSLTNRSARVSAFGKGVKIAKIIRYGELREQLDHVRSLRFQENELIWLQGQTFYGVKGMFAPDYIDFLRHFRLPDYELHEEDGQFVLRFPGKWKDTTYWEIYGLPIISTLLARAEMSKMTKFELDVMYSKAKAKLWDKLQRLKNLPDLNLTCFATRRRHEHLFQEWAILAAKEALGDGFTGTSNAFFAMKHGLEAKGTNAHERPMVAAALANTPEERIQSQYDVMQEWQAAYDGALRVFLPDTYGTTQFLANAPDWVADWKGARVDSKDPFTGGEELISWWRERGRDPHEKLLIFADGLDDDKIIGLHTRFHGRAQVGYGWGTLFANDLRGCHPSLMNAMHPLSLIIKPSEVNGRPAVKLSDNYVKATGFEDEIARYRETFGTAGVANIPVIV